MLESILVVIGANACIGKVNGEWFTTTFSKVPKKKNVSYLFI